MEKFKMYLWGVTLFLATPLLAFDEPAVIIRAGQGLIGMRGKEISQDWPEGYALKKTTGAYAINRLDQTQYPTPSPAVVRSWRPENFTSLQGLPEGTSLSQFRLVVHGLELKHLVTGIDSCSFDDFVHNHLNPAAPQGDKFIPYYPYFFGKKSIIAASVVSENLTATFGNAGFILTAPAENYIICGKEDIHTPTDQDFYAPLPDICRLLPAPLPKNFNSFGAFELFTRFDKHRLLSLSELLPSTKVSPIGEACHEQTATPLTKSTPQKQLKARRKTHKQIQEKQGEIPLTSLLQRASAIAPTDSLEDLFPEIKEAGKSWYNEVAINTHRLDTQTSVKISGIFLRTDEKQWREYITRPYVKALLEIAEAFDLPIVRINDGNSYQTNL